jgi:hypothetical protein
MSVLEFAVFTVYARIFQEAKLFGGKTCRAVSVAANPTPAGQTERLKGLAPKKF